MRLNEILIEQQLDEAPQGFLSKMAKKAKSFVPGSIGRQAKGDLEVGDEANWLIKQFDTFLGKVGGKATPQLVIDFLRKNNYPTGDAEQEMTKMTTGQKVGAGAAKAVKGVGKAAAAVGGAISKGIGNLAQAGADLKKANQDAKTQQATPPQNQNTQNPAQDKAQPEPNAQDNTQTDTNTPQDQTQTTNTKQPAGNPDNNLAISGAKKKPPVVPQKKIVNQSIDWSEAQFIFEDGEVTLSRGQLDNIFMAAVRQAVARDEGGQKDQGTGVAPADAQQGGFKGAAQAAAGEFKAAGSTLPPEIKKQIEGLPARDKQQLLKML